MIHLSHFLSPALLLALDEHIRSIVRGELAARPAADGPPLIRADKTGLVPRAANKACREGRMRGTKIGARWYVTRTDLDAYVAEHRAPSPSTEETSDELGKRIKADLTAALNAPPKPPRRKGSPPPMLSAEVQAEADSVLAELALPPKPRLGRKPGQSKRRK